MSGVASAQIHTRGMNWNALRPTYTSFHRPSTSDAMRICANPNNDHAVNAIAQVRVIRAVGVEAIEE